MKLKFFIFGISLLFSNMLFSDIVELKNGTVYSNVFALNEGIQLYMWDSIDKVGHNPTIFKGSEVKRFTFKRDEEAMKIWDAKPELPDLSVTFIEILPELYGLHAMITYDDLGRPIVELPDKPITDRDKAAMTQEEVLKDMKFVHAVGDELTFIAHVKNVGFKTAGKFDYVWKIDDKVVGKGTCKDAIPEMEEKTFTLKHKLPTERSTIAFEITPSTKEISTANNQVCEMINAWCFYYLVGNGRIKAWHEFRSGFGTFCFEDFYRWHVDYMNRFFEASVFPASPNGCFARVRLGKIIYSDDVNTEKELLDKTKPQKYNGGWTWTDSTNEIATGNFGQVNPEWRCQNEWSLPHELGHQLGIADWYAMDFQGSSNLTWKDNGKNVALFFRHPCTMMHWHGPHVFGEVDAAFMNLTWNKPRGYFGEYLFAIPEQNSITFLDVNNVPLTGAKIEIFQTNSKPDKNKEAVTFSHGKYFPIIEDGDLGGYNLRLPDAPVIVGKTDKNGKFELPNRPVAPVRTFTGFERKPSPFGNIDVLGGRGIMLIRVTFEGKEDFYGFSIYDFVVQYLRGNKESYNWTFRTPFSTSKLPFAPENVKAEKLEKNQYKITWTEPPVKNEVNYLEKPIGYKVYYRISDEASSVRPWYQVATVDPNTFEFTIDASHEKLPQEQYFYGRSLRFAVSSIGESGFESELIRIAIE